MTSLKQIEANRRNALKSTGPRTEQGKQQSRRNALRHGLTAETIITALENAAEYEAFELGILDDYAPRTTAERELATRLASVLWRLRRATNVETGLLQIQAELMGGRKEAALSRRARQPRWYGELDVAATVSGEDSANADGRERDAEPTPQSLAYCFLQVNRLQYGMLESLTRYETALWRQAAQLLFILQSAARR